MTIADDLSQALGSAYQLRNELGGGGMSRVFLATEVALGRTVVIKVLLPELAAGVSLERFRREAQVLAALQHPLIVPLLTAGEGNGFIWYVMPYVEGESLRGRLERQGKLASPEVIRLLRDVAEALAYAHARGVIHRDIKPENILLTTGRAVVTDFGVAKALSDAAGTASAGLTGMGLSLGTPTYMSPEQAAADPGVDARADLYSLGCVGYELLAGRPPFIGMPAAQLLAAHVVTPPQPLGELAPDAAPELVDLIMQCLAKRPADRPSSAGDLVAALDGLATPATGVHATGVFSREPVRAAMQRLGAPVVLGAYLLVAAVVCLAARLAMLQFGWPDWVFTVAATASVLGGGLVLMGALGRLPLLTTRTLVIAGGATVTLLAAAAVGHGVLRRAGVGPMGSLLGAGKLGERDRIIIADFANTASDTVLSTVVTEAFRTDFTQSRAISVVGRAAVNAVLERMQRPTSSRLDPALAREVAVRDGVKGVVEGDIVQVGGQFILSARLVAPQGGEVLAAFRETADGDRELIGAIDRLSKELREKIGESLQAIRASGGLERVTTTSLEALRKYTEAIRVGDAPDLEHRKREIALLRDAVALDSTFAMAWRRLGVRLQSGPVVDPREVVDAISRAYRLRDRLTPIERGLAEASYYAEVTKEEEREAAAYRGVLELDPDNRIALNNLAYKIQTNGGADSLLLAYSRRLMAVDSSAVNAYVWVTDSYYRMGLADSAHASARRFAQHFGVGPTTVFNLAHWLAYDRQYDSAASMLRRSLDDPAFGPAARGASLSQLASLASLRGRLVEAARYDDQWQQQRAAEDSSFGQFLPLMRLGEEVQNLAWRRQEPALARAALERGLKATPMERLPLPLQRPSDLAFYWALSGDAPRARQALQAYQRLGGRLPPELHARYAADSADEVNGAEAWVAAAEGQAARAAELTRPIVQRHRTGYLGSLATLGFFYAMAHQPDSAVAVFERFISSRDTDRAWFEAFYLPRAYLELGAQYEALGQRAKAAAAYQGFIDLWRNADPELQPQVRKAREALARVTGEPRRAS